MSVEGLIIFRSSRVVMGLALFLGVSEAHSQEQGQDLIQALRQQREEALDKVANAYVTIMKLQRELDRIKAEAAMPKVAPNAAPK